MINEITVSLYLDKRRIKKNGKFPLKIRVFTPYPRKQKFYPSGYEFTEQEFQSIYETTKPRSQYKETRLELQLLEAKVLEIAKELKPFSFQELERELFNNSGSRDSLIYWFDSIIQELEDLDRHGSAIAYNAAKKSMQKYCLSELRKSFDRLIFRDINPNLLEHYEKFMVNEGKSLTTVGMYLRALRAVFNKAIDHKIIEPEFYPFGKRKYQIPAPKKVKKALTVEQLKTLFECHPNTPEQEKARDYWFFSYACSGMNFKDILLLKNKDLRGDRIVYYRSKTKTTSKADQRSISVYLNDYSKSFIEKYRKPGGSEDYLFPVLSKDDKPRTIHRKKQNFIRSVNQHLKKLAILNDLPGDISTYWARHTFATNSVRKGASMEFIQESLGHGNLKTTQNYFAGFEDDKKREFANQLFNF